MGTLSSSATNADTRVPPRVTAREADGLIEEFARRQHGAVARAQLLTAGVSANHVDRRLRGGRLSALRRGVYLAGPLTLPLTSEMSAVLASGASAVLSHRSAGTLRQLMPHAGGEDAVDVTVPPVVRRHLPGVRFHRMPLRDDEVTVFEGIPVTTPARTLYDLASTLPDRALERAVAEGIALRLTSQAQLEAFVARYTGRAGARRLSAIAGAGHAPARTRSLAEESFLALIRTGQLPRPEVNVQLRGHEVDFFWPDQRLVVEIDGFAFHSSRHRFDGDRRRDAVLVATGVRVMRATWQQIEDEPAALLVRVAQALAFTG